MMRLGEDRARGAACAMVDGAAAGRTSALRPTGRLARAAAAVCIALLLAAACALGAPRGACYHFDTPLTVQNETQALHSAGFSSVTLLGHWGATHTLRAEG